MPRESLHYPQTCLSMSASGQGGTKSRPQELVRIRVVSGPKYGKSRHWIASLELAGRAHPSLAQMQGLIRPRRCIRKKGVGTLPIQGLAASPQTRSRLGVLYGKIGHENRHPTRVAHALGRACVVKHRQSGTKLTSVRATDDANYMGGYLLDRSRKPARGALWRTFAVVGARTGSFLL